MVFLTSQTAYFIAYPVARFLGSTSDEEFFVREDQVEWENPDSEDAETAIAEARANCRVVYSDFSAWGYDAPDSYKNTLGEQVSGGNA